MPEIDFVATWVDGSDPHLSRARERARSALGYGKGAARYRQQGEIYYLIASILKYAPFARRIYIITDNQKPPLLDDFVSAGLCDADRLRLISHDVIFDSLDVPRPTFNSRVIEAAMWRIPGLAEQFVYCNDDMFLNAPLREEEFFRDGKPVIAGAMTLPEAWHPRTSARRILGYFRSGVAPMQPKHRRAQERGAKHAGVNGRFLLPHHNPHPLRRSTAEAFYTGKPDVLSNQMQHQFRHASQYLQVSLSNHLERQVHGAKFERKRAVAYLDSNLSPSAIKRALAMIRNGTVPFGCVQNLERFSLVAQSQIHATLREKFSTELPPSLAQPAGVP